MILLKAIFSGSYNFIWFWLFKEVFLLVVGYTVSHGDVLCLLCYTLYFKEVFHSLTGNKSAHYIRSILPTTSPKLIHILALLHTNPSTCGLGLGGKNRAMMVLKGSQNTKRSPRHLLLTATTWGAFPLPWTLSSFAPGLYWIKH